MMCSCTASWKKGVRRNLSAFTLACVSATLSFPISGAETTPPRERSETDVVADLMDRARQAMMEAHYQSAITTYSKLVNMPDHAYRQDALELLGLAYERSGQMEKAKVEYQRYIQLYPKGDGTERVKQRLAGITTATWQAPKKLKETKKQSEKADWQFYGAFSQYLRRDAGKFENQPEVVYNYGLTTLLDATARRRSSDLDIKSRVSAAYQYDLDGSLKNQQTLRHLYVDVNQHGTGWSAALGRQTAYEGGILGRYDGFNIGKRMSSGYTVKFVAGMPVEKVTDLSLNTSRHFYGVNVDTGIWQKYWETKAYFIQQQADGMTDRQAVGGELRFLHPDVNLYTLIDYDIAYGSLNIFSTQGSWVQTKDTTFNYLLDYRNAPPITTSNALIGQSVTTLSDLKKIYSQSEIEQLAQDRTPRSTLAMFGVTHQLNESYRIDSNISATTLSSTTASGGVSAMTATGTDLYFTLQLTGRDLLVMRDTHILGLRQANTKTYNSTSLYANSRFPMGDRWDINPRLYLSRLSYDNNDSQTSVTPGLRFNFRWNRYGTVEFDSSYDFTTRNTWLGSQKYTYYYFDIGYRIDF